MSERQMRRLLARAEVRIREEFLGLVAALRRELPLARLQRLLERGRAEEAVEVVRQAGSRLGLAWSVTFGEAAASAAQFLRSESRIFGITYDGTNDRAVRLMRANGVRLARALAEQQRDVITQVVVDGLRRGLNPRQQARAIRDALGLTDYQERVVANYRRELESASRSALDRALRDRRSDAAVARAASQGEQLPPARVDALVEGYRRRLVASRAETIARTEAIRSVHQATEEVLAQAVEAGHLDPSKVVREWNTAGDGRVRDSHTSMSGQIRPLGVPFRSGNGNLLMYPGDPNGPAGDVINCRCAVGTRLLGEGEVISVTEISAGGP